MEFRTDPVHWHGMRSDRATTPSGTPTDEPGRVPDVVEYDEPPKGLWQDGFGRAATRSVQALVIVALLALVGWVMIRLRLVVVPVLIATLIAAAVSPLVSWLERRRLPRPLAVWAALLGGIGFVALAGWFIIAAVVEQWPELREGAVNGLEELRTFASEGPLRLTDEQLERFQQAAVDATRRADITTGAISGATAVGEVLAGIFLGAVVLYFLLKDGREIWRFLVGQVPGRRTRERLLVIGDRSTVVLGGYVRGTATIALVDAVLIGVALVILRVQLALPLSVVVFIGAFVPLVGATIAGILAALIALVSNGLVTALIVVAVVVAVNQIEGDVLAPIVLGRSLRLHPLAILLALTAGTILAGIVGAILAVPFAAVAWATVKTWRELSGRRPSGALDEETLPASGP
jgi:predicted PurR-regulated permease PerM